MREPRNRDEKQAAELDRERQHLIDMHGYDVGRDTGRPGWHRFHAAFHLSDFEVQPEHGPHRLSEPPPPPKLSEEAQRDHLVNAHEFHEEWPNKHPFTLWAEAHAGSHYDEMPDHETHRLSEAPPVPEEKPKPSKALAQALAGIPRRDHLHLLHGYPNAWLDGRTSIEWADEHERDHNNPQRIHKHRPHSLDERPVMADPRKDVDPVSVDLVSEDAPFDSAVNRVLEAIEKRITPGPEQHWEALTSLLWDRFGMEVRTEGGVAVRTKEPKRMVMRLAECLQAGGPVWVRALNDGPEVELTILATALALAESKADLIEVRDKITDIIDDDEFEAETP